MTVSELYEYLNIKYPRALSCEWDNDGKMCVPDPERTVIRVLIALDITDDAIQYAVLNKFDTIISHHPLIFHPIREFSKENLAVRKILKLCSEGIAAFSFHTRLDAAENGVNDALAELIELNDATPLICENKPLGRVGRLDSETDARTLAVKIKDVTGASKVTFADGGRKISRISVIGGAGGDFISEAKSVSDALVTGECGYNKMSDAAEDGFTIISAGHFETENPVCAKLSQAVAEADSLIYTEIYRSDKLKTL